MEDDAVSGEVKGNAEFVPGAEHAVAIEVEGNTCEGVAEDHFETPVKVGAFVVDEVDILPVVVDHPEYIAEICLTTGQEAEVEGEREAVFWAPGRIWKEVERGALVLDFAVTAEAEAVRLRGGGAGYQYEYREQASGNNRHSKFAILVFGARQCAI